jgi:hypothetical protein
LRQSRALGDAGIDVTGWRVIPHTLEDVFIDRLAQEKQS